MTPTHKQELAKYKRLYQTVCDLVDEIGSNGEISSKDKAVDAVMNALYDIDEGVRIEPKEGE